MPVERPLADLLSASQPPFTIEGGALRQLHYIEKYVRVFPACCEPRCVAIETYYIDRDYIEDYSAFYSKNVFPYPNHCRRVHYFAGDASTIRSKFAELFGLLAGGKTLDFETRRKEMESRYLGFSVVKPLAGTPVGRTVLRPLQSTAGGTYARAFPCAREYSVHLHGIELVVNGLAFQQQDVGVSACATTALWSALHKIQDHEHASFATPAQITVLASRFSLPYGRPMPSEGLSVDQMCQAVHGLNLAPDLIPVHTNAETARGVIHSALLSGFPPVLILKYPTAGTAHAVCVVGEKLSITRVSGAHLLAKGKSGREFKFDEAADGLMGVYFHDDRFGPYLAGDIVNASGSPQLRFSVDEGGTLKLHEPQLTHVLVPIHVKIRLSFLGLREIAIRTLAEVLKLSQRAHSPIALDWFADNPPRLSTWIRKGHRYIQDLLEGSNLAEPVAFIDAWSLRHVPRYCGVVRIDLGDGSFDLVVDCTSTKRNPNFVAIISPAETVASAVAAKLAERIGCPWIATR